ncbi:hypothetical protein Z517_10072 [Fonsecaea pedrosoi CBS 271.37]|uniref:Unplaced genomic scaffold supercont1.7, whole genome shotgun sequence n=1 Tax=Fonsecaea pedrosoi CBS 271.37 TaxID=1442368 RepID=A0A0D2DCG9_9EURO|nr:uncharacterized protein Z517_10072 [Fonsecaea pedrosoi CBS 271.37]KIW75331.1 hypothetical protein Z517_10072 [Fonsecaea pedrosoi CBS 271.37]
MVYNTEATEWPSFEINPAIKDLISRFFKLLDTQDSSVGNVLADEIFAPNGQIRGSRDSAWKVVTERRHAVLKVFSADLEGSDLSLIGHVEMSFNNGKSVEGEFAGRSGVEGATGSSPRLTLYQVWADSTPVTRDLIRE